MAHPLAPQLCNLQTLVEVGVDTNTTVVFPAQLMSAIGDIGAFFARETAATARPWHRRSGPPQLDGRRRPTADQARGQREPACRVTAH